VVPFWISSVEFVAVCVPLNTLKVISCSVMVGVVVSWVVCFSIWSNTIVLRFVTFSRLAPLLFTIALFPVSFVFSWFSSIGM